MVILWIFPASDTQIFALLKLSLSLNHTTGVTHAPKCHCNMRDNNTNSNISTFV